LNAIDVAGIPWFLNNTIADFWGDGSDGALTVAAGTTTIDGVKHYTNVTIQTGGTLTKTAGPTSLIIFCTGNLDIQGTGKIDLTGKGCAGGWASNVQGAAAHPGKSCAFGGAGGESSLGAGAGGTATPLFGSKNPFAYAMCGSGGGGSYINFGVSAGTDGGAGGGGINIFVKGTVTFSATSSIICSGAAGGAATTNGAGGGAGGYMWLRYLGTYTNGGVTLTFAGGAGGGGTAPGAAGAAGKYIIENMATRGFTEGP
jgi:hypothetical protein